MKSFTINMITRKLLILLFLFSISMGQAFSQWAVYNAHVMPNENDPSFGTSGLAADGMLNTLVADPDNPGNYFLEMLTIANSDNGTWRRVFGDPVTDITIVMRVKSANNDGRRVLELDVDNGGFRERLYINQEDNKLRLQHSAGFGADNEFSLPDEASVKDWNIYRLTKDSEGNVKLYVNEDPEPLAEGKTGQGTSNNHFRFGDTNSSHNISALIDWVIWDESGVYAPGEGTPIPEELLPQEDKSDWYVYDGSVFPNDFEPAFVTASGSFNETENAIVDDPDIDGNKLLWMDVSGNPQNAFLWRMNFANHGIELEELTLVMRVKGHEDRDMAMDLDMDFNGKRSRVSIHRETKLARIRNGSGDNAELDIETTNWNIYRFTMTATETRLFINEDPEPVMVFVPANGSNRHFRFGDGDSGNTFGAYIDWVIWDVTGAYAPGEGETIPEGLIPEEPPVPAEDNWRVYDGRNLPSRQIPVFDESNVAGVGATNQILADPEDEDNGFLELITAVNADNFMWRTPLQPETPGATFVMKVKAANDEARRVLEFDIHHNGIRERLYINREANRIRLNEAIGGGDGGEIEAPEGVNLSDWNIYRITKAGGEINLYLNEDPEPIASGITTTSTSQQYFRFGDGNGSHNAGALIDWIIWDETGAYAPGEGSPIPANVVTPNWDATLAELLADGALIDDFSPETTNYSVTLPYGYGTVPEISATASYPEALVEVTQATELPGEATVVVTAFNGFTIKTYTISFLEADHNWRIYDGRNLPTAQIPVFDESNVAGVGATNQILADPEDEDNGFLELITAVNADNFMWRTPLQPETPAVTFVMKVKAANDESRRVLEFDIHHNGIRERVYINREANRIRLNEAIGGGDGGEIEAPEGVDLSDWNIYRITKAGGEINLYLNEDPVPIASGITTTSTSQQYFRFGDGNGSHNAGALIDWIIWDETGAYAPGEGSGIPSPVITPNWDATLAELLVDGAMIDDFSPETTDYEVVLPTGNTEIPVISATLNYEGATMEIVQAEEIPGEATVVVTAFNGFTVKTYNVAIRMISTDASLADLLVDGVTVEGFEPEVKEYFIELPQGTTEVPEITAVANDELAVVEVAKPETLPGDAVIVVTAEDGNFVEYIIHFTLDPTSAIVPDDLSFRMFPNPTVSALTIEHQYSGNTAEIKVISMGGQVLIHQFVNDARHTIDVSNLKNGLYILQLRSDNQSREQLFIKQ